MRKDKPDHGTKQYKELHELSHDELEALLAKEEALLANGTAARVCTKKDEERNKKK